MKLLRKPLPLTLTGALVMATLFGGCASYPHSSKRDISRIEQSPQYRDGKFRNDKEVRVMDLDKIWSSLKEVTFNKHPLAGPQQQIPLSPLTEQDFQASEEQSLRFARLGHSTVMLEMSGKFWLTDPVFSERASPVQWMGPKRFHPLPFDVAQLPEIEAVIISHNHYDHLDYGSIVQLKDKVNHFVVPLGIGDTLRGWGVAQEKITELDWWENKTIGDVELVSTPAQHFSGRGIRDSAKTLWSSWVIRNPQHSVFFSGDTGYFDGFKEIGNRYGPFDYAFMECGAYNQNWADVHMLPEQSLQAFIDIQGKTMIPVHNGTFDLAAHAWYDPMDQISQLAEQHDVTLLTPMIGQLIQHNDQNGEATSSSELSQDWWQTLMAEARQNPEVKAWEQKQKLATNNKKATSELALNDQPQSN